MTTQTPLPRLALLVLAATVMGCGAGEPDPLAAPAQEPETTRGALYEAPGITRWPGGQVPVCFNGRATSSEAQWLKDDLAHSWSAVARVDFQYSNSCPFPGATAYVRIDWVGAAGWGIGGNCGLGVGNPAVCALGWCDSSLPMADCNAAEYREAFGAVVVHEIGHALGFAHEHQRPDVTNAPPGCLREPLRSDYPGGAAGDTQFQRDHDKWERDVKIIPGGTILTSYYEPDSIMNYCRGRTSTQMTPLPYQAGYKAAERLSAGDQFGAGSRYQFRTPYWMAPVLRAL